MDSNGVCNAIYVRKFLIGIILLFTLIANAIVWAADCELKKNISIQEERAGLCKFDVQKKSFEGTPANQAACLTRKVKPQAEIGKETITPFLTELVGKPAPNIYVVQVLLNVHKVKWDDVGGDINKSISANYFIIHDTSTPNCSVDKLPKGCQIQGELPVNRDDESWIYNKNFGGHPKKFPYRLAHVFTNRIGGSITEVDFSEHIATTKFELCTDSRVKNKLFVGIENIQPRVGEPKIPNPGKKVNDFVAPIIGFPSKQYDRLALLYLVASARRGQWLIPAFHAVLDTYYKNGHDDPQNFDINQFSAALQKYLEEITSVEIKGKVKDGITKHQLQVLSTEACSKIVANAKKFKIEKTTKTTQYFTPLFQPGSDGGLRQEDRNNCLKMEGACIVGNYLYNSNGAHGKRFERDKVKFIFGQGNQISNFNKTNALIPCRTLAADLNYYKIGTAIYIPSFKGKICPQNRKPVDGCFIIGDIGSAIKGPGRFDIFTGECSNYDGKLHICRDKENVAFNIPANTEFHIIPRETEYASALRKEVDTFINNGWRLVQ